MGVIWFTNLVAAAHPEIWPCRATELQPLERVPKASLWERRDKKEAERLHPNRKEVKTNTEIQCRNPAGIESRPVEAGHQPEATIASSSEMAARSVWGESKSRVIESRNTEDRWSLRNRSTEGRADTLQKPGVKVRPGSESRANGRKGSLGTCEIRLSPSEKSQQQGDTGRTTPRRAERDPVFCASETAGQRRVLRNESNEFDEKESGSLSSLIVAIESRRTIPRKPGSSQGGCRKTELPLGNT